MVIETACQSFISDIGDYAIYADARFGDNGDYWGVPTYEVGSPSASTPGYCRWDSDPSNGIETGWLDVELHVGANHVVTWEVQGGGDGILQFSNVQYGDISKVRVRAAVQQSGLLFEWRSLVLQFYDNGVLKESSSMTSAQQPKADTTQSGSVKEMITTITPAWAHNDELILTGQIHLHANQGVYPGANDLFGQVLINA